MGQESNMCLGLRGWHTIPTPLPSVLSARATQWCYGPIPRHTRGMLHLLASPGVAPGCGTAEGRQHLPGEAQQLPVQRQGNRTNGGFSSVLLDPSHKTNSLHKAPSAVTTLVLHTGPWSSSTQTGTSMRVNPAKQSCDHATEGMRALH